MPRMTDGGTPLPTLTPTEEQINQGRPTAEGICGGTSSAEVEDVGPLPLLL